MFWQQVFYRIIMWAKVSKKIDIIIIYGVNYVLYVVKINQKWHSSMLTNHNRM